MFVHDRDTDADGIFDEAGAVSTVRVSLSAANVQGNGDSLGPSLSPNGRFVGFFSGATNLVAGVDSNGAAGDVFVRDRDTDADGIFDEPGAVSTTRVSVATDGTQGNAQSNYVQISANARHVAFLSHASNLVPGDTNMCHTQNNTFLYPCPDVFVRDRDTDGDGVFDEPGAVSTTRVSVDSAGNQSDGPSCMRMAATQNIQVEPECPQISADGRSVSFTSFATNLVPGDANIFCQHDTVAGNDNCPDIFVHDRDVDLDGIFDEAGAISTTLVSVDTAGSQANHQSSYSDISADGRFVAFDSSAVNLAIGDTNGVDDVFLRDRDTDADGIFDEPGAVSTIRVSLADSGTQATGGYSGTASLSADASSVAFTSGATNLVAGDTNNSYDVFVRNRAGIGGGGTPTATPTETATPSSTPTNTATPTSTPANTATATPITLGGIDRQPDLATLPTAAASSRSPLIYLLAAAFAIVTASAACLTWRRTRGGGAAH